MAYDDAVPPFNFNDGHGRLEDPQRLERLRNTGLLTARHRPALDAITHLAAQITEVPAAGVALVAADKLVFPSFHGTEVQQENAQGTPTSYSFCQYVVMNDAPLVVGDARTHPVLSSHAAVLGGALVAYAGFPVHAPDGEVLGALCVMDVVPRTWTPAHLSGLKDLATAVDTKIALRLSRRELHLDHERLMHVLDGATHTLIIIADADGVIRTMNHAAEVALIPVTDLLGTEILSDLTGAPRPWEPQGDLDDARDGTLLHSHDGRRIFSVRVDVLHDSEGEVDGYIAVGDDVTAQRRTEDLLRDTELKQAEAVQHLEALDAQRSTLIVTAGHELRTPLANILGYTELLIDGEGGELTSAQRSFGDVVVRNGLRLQHLIEDLLSVIQMMNSEADLVRTEVDVNRLTEETWHSLQDILAGRDLRATMDVPRDIPNVSGDLKQLERVLLNLLTNAVKFTPDGGVVQLTVRTDPQGVGFEVTDTGPGIPEHDQKAVFEPFFRTEDANPNAVQGSGIGLAVVRSIVDSHGGEITLTSVVGQGTRVRFTIPVQNPEYLGGQARVA